MAQRHWIERDGHRIEIEAERGWRRDLVQLLVDGETAAEGETFARTLRLEGPAGEGTVVAEYEPGVIGVRRSRFRLVDGEEKTELRPPAGSRAERLERMREERPGVYAGRHVAKGVAEVALGLIGIGALIRLAPEIPWPDIPFPRIPMPDIPWPDVPAPDLPSWSPPAWIEWPLDHSRYWMPVLIGVLIALNELRRRRKGGSGAKGEEKAPGQDPA